MPTRRHFIQTTSVLAAGAFFRPPMFSSKKEIGLQLYTIRDAMQADPSGSLAKVAHIGYTTVEGATYTGSQKFYGMDPSTFAAMLKKDGLSMPSSHYRLGEEQANGQAVQGTIMHGWDKAVDDAAAVGISYMVCAYLSESERGSIDHYKAVAKQLNEAGERCAKNGIQLCYHNHDFEFIAQNGVLPYDVLLGETNTKLVKMEMDLYWVTKAGKDPLALFSQHPGRFPLWHMKDMDSSSDHAFTEVGNGTIDFSKILAKSQQAGLRHFFVEQDKTPGDPFESITKSFNYINGHLLKNMA